MSPGKRKSDSQKKKNLVPAGPQPSDGDLQDSLAVEEESPPMEEESEQLELIESDLPQMIIENAREKILSNKCLQEKLAENINKFLGSDGSISQSTKQAESGPAIQESSIDEFLDLQQGEIHMTEEAIQEILEQTESDPAFQGLFDIFDFGKTKGSRNVSHGISTHGGGIENGILASEKMFLVLHKCWHDNPERDNSQGCLSYTGDHSKEACVLKPGCSGTDLTLEEHLKMHTVALGEFPEGSKLGSESNSVERDSPGHKNTFESGQNQVSCSQFSGHSIGTYNPQRTASTDGGSDKALLCQDAQNLPNLQYDNLGVPPSSLSRSAEYCSLPNSILSEKTNGKFLTPPRPDDTEMVDGADAASSNHSAQSDKELGEGAETSVFSTPGQQNTEDPLSHCHIQDKFESDSATPQADGSIPDVVEEHLDVADTSNRAHSGHHSVHQEPCSERQQSEDSGITPMEMQEPSSTKDADHVFLTSGQEGNAEPPTVSSCTTSVVCHSPLPEPEVELSPAKKVPASVSSSSQEAREDPSGIVSLKIIISDDPFISSDAELSNAVSSITGDNLPTIVLSSPAKSPAKVEGASSCITSEEAERTGDTALVEQNLLVLRPQDSVVSTLNVQNEECTVFSISGASNVAKDGGLIQLMPATSTSFNSPNSVYIATCVTEPTGLSTSATPSNLVVLPGSSASLGSQVPTTQQLRTPPRTSNVFALNPPMSPNFSQGSTIIIASPVQPVLQGMVGMIPVSIMGQSGNTFSDPSRQVLHMPLQPSLGSRGVPKLPLPPKSQRVPRSKPNAGKPMPNGSEPANRPSSRVQRTGNSDQNASDVKKKSDTVAADATSSSSKQTESHRRVLCFDNAISAPAGSTQASHKEKHENPSLPGNSPSTVISSAKVQSSKRERERTLPRILCKPNITNRNSAVKETQLERKNLGPGLALDVLRKQTANKENELERSPDKGPKNQEVATLSNGQQNGSLHHEKNSSPAQEPTKKQGLQSNPNSKNVGVQPSKESKKDPTKSPNQAHSMTSPLTKQAVEMLQDIQRHSPNSKLPDCGDLPVPRTPSGTGDRLSEDTFDVIRTPTCRRYSEDSTTPRIMVPPATPDMPTCSPASETGSENSVSMAAHTLMILSRAAIARTSTATPLKDNMQQFKPLRSSAKKRKPDDVVECERNSRTTSKKDLHNFTIPIKKKKVKQKKLPIAFPAGMDVDKFLLSLHYDE
ncbi:hypothetical protein JRQ81_019662 [Phrynocephalus forsythii]|uniref:Protein NPAT C-terminal domain-containing protein n=1 Tax=Phrynocephalus forsythii TaxID=171643 RepID=A0A9Q1AYR0_9SAUR|nr:hypothetical protein JRQ81_019662 [Phrynocephalus forsythii]